MRLPKKVLFLFLIPLFAFSAHKYYLSMMEIEYSEEQQSLQIIINVFMDDIELAINSEYTVDLRLDTKQEMKDTDVYFEKYLKETLKFKVEDKESTFNYLGHEYDSDLVFFYLEIPQIKNPQPLEVHNTILVKYFEDQKNVVKLKVGKKRRSEILNKANDKALLKF